MEELSDEHRQMLLDRVEPIEMVEYLDLTIEDLIDAFEDRVIENLQDIFEVIGIVNDDIEETD